MKIKHFLPSPIAAAVILTVSFVEALAGDTRLIEPYAPKPSGPTPEGWEIKILEGSVVESVTRLKSGREIKVSTPAYELVPIGDVLVISDPGFNPTLANSQTDTIGAVLTKYSEEAHILQERLKKIIEELEKNLK